MTEPAGRIRSLRRLGRWQWRVLLTAPFVLGLSALRLRTRGLRAALSAAQPRRVAPFSAAERLAQARATAYAVDVAVKYGPWRPRCLLRSLTLGWFLGRRGLPFDLRIGAAAGMTGASAGGGAESPAHAWIEVEGAVINDRDEVAERYPPFARS